MQLLGVGHGLQTGAHVGLGDDFQQRCAGAVQVDAALANEVLVQRFAGVFFQMRAHQAHRHLAFAHEEFHIATLHYRNLKLADLVALGKVRVEVVLARKNTFFGDVRAHGQAERNGAFHGTPVHDRQGAGQGQIDRAGLRIGLGTKGGAGARKNLGLRGQLAVRLEADDDFIAANQRCIGAVQKDGFLHSCHINILQAWPRENPWPTGSGGPH